MTYQPVDILLAEDSKADAEMTIRTLKRRHIANSIEWVRDGVEAQEFLSRTGKYCSRAEGRPKLVLLDLKMPRMDGLQLLEWMKADADLATIPVVMLTSSREEGDLLASYRLGVNSFIVKPVDFSQFANTLEQVGMYWLIANAAPREGGDGQQRRPGE